MIRLPAVSGTFYPSDPGELGRQIDRFSPPSEKISALACVVPHAGYLYSGGVAGAVYASLRIPARCILLGPRHFPRGERMAILTRGFFRTPLGDAPIDEELASELARRDPRLREDAVAHEREHSLEVQIPFLQRHRPEVRIVPVALATDRYPALEELGRAVAQTVAAQGEPVLLVASSDLNHYESEAVTRKKDELAIARMLALDPRGLYDTVRKEEISMCGYAAATAMLVAARELGATEATLVLHATSGDVNGDRAQVVGYAGIVVR